MNNDSIIDLQLFCRDVGINEEFVNDIKDLSNYCYYSKSIRHTFSIPPINSYYGSTLLNLIKIRGLGKLAIPSYQQKLIYVEYIVASEQEGKESFAAEIALAINLAISKLAELNGGVEVITAT